MRAPGASGGQRNFEFFKPSVKCQCGVGSFHLGEVEIDREREQGGGGWLVWQKDSYIYIYFSQCEMRMVIRGVSKLPIPAPLTIDFCCR